MSNQAATPNLECEYRESCDAIELIIQPNVTDLGEFSVRRLLPNSRRKLVGPWIFFDHMGPTNFTAGEGINVRPHPHINLATVTYLFDGEILHRDSLGSNQVIRPGDINLMIAGKGIVHSERERPELTASNHSLHGLQLWLALPVEHEEIEPAFYHYPSSDIPNLGINGVDVRVMLGEAYGVISPVKTYSDTLYVEASLKKGQKITLPAAQEQAVYVVNGSVMICEIDIPEHAMAILNGEPNIELEATQDTRIAIVGGDAMDDRHVEWNFVSSRKERIEQAKKDWITQSFPKVPGDEGEYIPLPE